MSDCKPQPFRVHAKFYAYENITYESAPVTRANSYLEVNPILSGSARSGWIKIKGKEFNVNVILAGRILLIPHDAGQSFRDIDGEIEVHLKDHCSCRWRKGEADGG